MAMPEAMPEAIPMAKPEAIPKAVPETIPKAVPEATPKATPNAMHFKVPTSPVEPAFNPSQDAVPSAAGAPAERERSALESKALRRARREAEDEDRIARAHARRREENEDDTGSVAETEHSVRSEGVSETGMSAIAGLVRLWRPETPGLQGILARAPSAKPARGALRFVEPPLTRDAADEHVQPNPALPWLTHLVDAHVPAAAVPVPTRTVPVSDWTAAAARMSITTLGTLTGHSVADDEWVVRPVGPYRDGGVRYFPGFCVHGLADPSAVRSRTRFVWVPNASEAADEPQFEEVSDIAERVFQCVPAARTILSHLDLSDIVRLAYVSHSVHAALGATAVHEPLLRRFLGPAGYTTWPSEERDPLPLSLADAEAYVLSAFIEKELVPAAVAYIDAGHHLDRRIPRLARAAMRGYSKVLARVRVQPQGLGGEPTVYDGVSPHGGTHAVSIAPPYTPGIASVFRVWVPYRSGTEETFGSELQRVERELFVAGVWRFLQPGDVAMNMARPDRRNDGRYVFTGEGLAPLSTTYDPIGHVPPYFNLLLFPPAYYNSVLRSSADPIVFLDVLPFRAQIPPALQLVRDNVETRGPQRQLYRIAKWFYRASFAIDEPKSDVPDFLETSYNAHHAWNGTVVLEADGTAEHAAKLIDRCIAPDEDENFRTELLQAVLAGTNVRLDVPPPHLFDEQALFPWSLDLRRSRPGHIWLRYVEM